LLSLKSLYLALNKESQLNNLNILFGLFKKYLPNKLVISTAGNHEGFPADSFPPHTFRDVPSRFKSDWLYNELSDQWPRFGIGEDQKIRNSIRDSASFVTKPYPGLRVISFNTNYCSRENFWVYLNQYDPDNVLSWLIRQLQDAEDAGDKAHLIGHSPPGHSHCLKEWSANLYDIVNRYENTITGMFFGHHHKDQFAVFYANGSLDDPIHVAYVGPCLSTSDAFWPAFRIYTIDGNYQGSSYRVLDHETYVLDIDKANAEDDLTLALEYKAKEAYGMNSLLPEEWNKLIERFIKDDNLFQQYWRYYGHLPQRSPCNGKCKFDMLCEMRSGRSNDPQLCKDLPGSDQFTQVFDEQEFYSSVESLIESEYSILPPECAR